MSRNDAWKNMDADPVAEKLPLRVTSISPQKKRNDRFSLFHDKTFLIGVSSQTLLDFSLDKGTELTHSLYQSIKKAEEHQKIKDRAYLLLSGRDHASVELKQKLLKKGFSAAIIEDVLQELDDKELLRDDRFAKKFATDKAELRKWGPIKIKQALLKKGVGKNAAEIAVENATSDLEQDQICVDLALKRRSRFLREPDLFKRKQKIYRYLAGKGYTSDSIKKALPIILEKLNAE